MTPQKKRIFCVQYITRAAPRSRSFSTKHAAKVWIYQTGEWEDRDLIFLYCKDDLIHETSGKDVLNWRNSGSNKTINYPVDTNELSRLDRQRRGVFGVESFDVHGDNPVAEFETLEEAKHWIYRDEWGLSARISVRSPNGDIVYETTGVDVCWWHAEGGASAAGRPYPDD